jgi:nucleoside-diphosphate-sugar epimerase
MKILVTGATGFIGSHLVRRLLSDGDEVVAATRAGSSTWRLDDVRRDVEFLELDLSAPLDGRLTRGLRGIEVVHHLAAAGVNPRYDSGEAVVAANVVGTTRLLALASALDVRRFVYCGSCFEYGSGNGLVESALPQPQSDYAASKSAAWLLAHSHSRRNGLPVVSLRPFTVYGPFESSYRLVPATIMGALDGRRIELTGGEQTRDFVYVEDAVSAFTAAASDAAPVGATFNVCTGVETSVAELARAVVEIAGGGELELGALPYRDNELWSLSGDPGAAAEGLSWRPATTLRDGLERTVTWFREQRDRHAEYAGVSA